MVKEREGEPSQPHHPDAKPGLSPERESHEWRRDPEENVGESREEPGRGGTARERVLRVPTAKIRYTSMSTRTQIATTLLLDSRTRITVVRPGRRSCSRMRIRASLVPIPNCLGCGRLRTDGRARCSTGRVISFCFARRARSWPHTANARTSGARCRSASPRTGSTARAISRSTTNTPPLSCTGPRRSPLQLFHITETESGLVVDTNPLNVIDRKENRWDPAVIEIADT